MTDKFGSQINELWANFGSDFTYPGNLPSYVEDYFEEQNNRVTLPAQTLPSHVQCLPQPGNFNMNIFLLLLLLLTHNIRKDLKYYMISRSFSTVPRSVRLVDITLWCVGSISTRHAWKRNRSIRVNILQKQDGCSSVSCLQPCCSRFFHGHLFRSGIKKKKKNIYARCKNTILWYRIIFYVFIKSYASKFIVSSNTFLNFRSTSSGRRLDPRRIPNVRHTVANFGRLPVSRFPRRSQFRVERIHVSSNYLRTELRHNACHASEQKTFPQACRLHNDRRLVFCTVDG